MSEGIQVNAGYRLRDMIAAMSVIVLGTAMALVVSAGEAPASFEIPAQLFGIGCAAIFVAYATGFFVDRIAEHWPVLSRSRDCPRIVLLGVPLITATLAATQIDAAACLALFHEWTAALRDLVPR